VAETAQLSCHDSAQMSMDKAVQRQKFAPWAPREGQPGAGDYLNRLLSCVPHGA
jgi:hypothetical protein